MSSLIYRKRVSVLVVANEQILGFHAEDPVSEQPYFFLPGGAIEVGESPEAAALRETREETGFSIELIPDQQCIKTYEFLWAGQRYLCETQFFLGCLTKEPQGSVKEPAYHKGVAWVPCVSVRQVFSYHPTILEAVEQLLTHSS